jgi:hypothetical protein
VRVLVSLSGGALNSQTLRSNGPGLGSSELYLLAPQVWAKPYTTMPRADEVFLLTAQQSGTAFVWTACCAWV